MMAEPTEHDENGMTNITNEFMNELKTIDMLNFTADPHFLQFAPDQCIHDDEPAAESRAATSSASTIFNTSNTLLTMNINFGLQPQLEPKLVVVVRSKIIRFRYKSELSNRKLGKEELVVIRLQGYEGQATILLHTVDKDNRKAHPYMLVGENCQNGMFIASENFSHANNYECVCKATLLVPTRKEYTEGLQARRKMAEMQQITKEEMRKDDYWNTNKNIKECKDFVLFVEVRVTVNGRVKNLYDYSPILSNAKDGKNFEIYKVSPCSAPCSGIASQTNFPVAVLTKTSFVPNDNVQVIFEDEEENWSRASEQVNIIKNCIEFAVPPYKDENLDDPRTVKMKLIDRQKDMETVAYDFIYEPSADQVQAKRRRKMPSFNVPDQVMEEAKKHQETHNLEQRKPPLKPHIRRYLHNKNRHGTSTNTPTVHLPQLTLKQENKSPPLKNPHGAAISTAVIINANNSAVYTQPNISKVGGVSFQTGLIGTRFASSSLVPSGDSMAEENYSSQNDLFDIGQLISISEGNSLPSVSSSAPVDSSGTSLNNFPQKDYDSCFVKEEPGNQSCMMSTEDHQNPERAAKVNQIIDFLKDKGPMGKQKAENMLAGNYDEEIAAILQQTDVVQQTQAQTVILNGLQDSSLNVSNSAASNIQLQPSPYTVQSTYNPLPQSTASSVQQISNFVQLPTVNSDFLGSHLLDAFDANDLEIDSHDLNDAVKVGDNNYRFFNDFDLETDCDPGALVDEIDGSSQNLKAVDSVLEKKIKDDDTSNVGEDSPEVIDNTLKVNKDTTEVTDDSPKVREDGSEVTKDRSGVSKDTSKVTEGTAKFIKDKSEDIKDKLEVNEDKSEVSEDKSEVSEDKSEVSEEKSDVSEYKSDVNKDKLKINEDSFKVNEGISEVSEDTLETKYSSTKIIEDSKITSGDETSSIAKGTLQITDTTSEVVVDQKQALIQVSRGEKKRNVDKAMGQEKDKKHQSQKNYSGKPKPVTKHANQISKEKMDTLCNDVESEMKDSHLGASDSGNKGKCERRSGERVSVSNIENNKTCDRETSNDTKTDSVSESLMKLKL